jgi:hypothetical protein
MASAVLTPIAAGLMSTFTPHTPATEWIVYQVIAGIGRGCGMQIVSLAYMVPDYLAEADIAITIGSRCCPKLATAARRPDWHGNRSLLTDIWRQSFPRPRRAGFQQWPKPWAETVCTGCKCGHCYLGGSYGYPSSCECWRPCWSFAGIYSGDRSRLLPGTRLFSNDVGVLLGNGLAVQTKEKGSCRGMSQ